MPLTIEQLQKYAEPGYYQDYPVWFNRLMQLSQLLGGGPEQIGTVMPGAALPKTFGGTPFRKVLEKAKEVFKTTKTPQRGGFVLPKGDYIEVPGQHRNIFTAFPKGFSQSDNPIAAFLETGAMRLNSFPTVMRGNRGAAALYVQGGRQNIVAEFTKLPTKHQQRFLLDLVKQHPDNYFSGQYKSYQEPLGNVLHLDDAKIWQIREWLNSLRK